MSREPVVYLQPVQDQTVVQIIVECPVFGALWHETEQHLGVQLMVKEVHLLIKNTETCEKFLYMHYIIIYTYVGK